MRLIDAQSTLKEVSGKSYTWLQQWGLSTIREAIRTINDRQSSTDADMERSQDIQIKIARKY
jgi:hypothetical protein